MNASQCIFSHDPWPEPISFKRKGKSRSFSSAPPKSDELFSLGAAYEVVKTDLQYVDACLYWSIHLWHIWLYNIPDCVCEMCLPYRCCYSPSRTVVTHFERRLIECNKYNLKASHSEINYRQLRWYLIAIRHSLHCTAAYHGQSLLRRTTKPPKGWCISFNQCQSNDRKQTALINDAEIRPLCFVVRCIYGDTLFGWWSKMGWCEAVLHEIVK